MRYRSCLASAAGLTFALCVAMLPLFAQKTTQGAEYKLAVITDRTDATYQVGEPVKFLVTLTKDGEPVHEGDVSWVTDKDQMPPQDKGTLALSSNASSISSQLDEPGFLRCSVTYQVGDNQSVSALAAAAVDPLSIKPSMPVPDDFDAFWDHQKKELDAVPLNLNLTPLDAHEERIACFDMQADCAGGAPVSGYLARPQDALPKSLPAILSVHGAGVRSSVLPRAVMMARKQMLALDINAHGLPNGKPDEFYVEQSEGPLKGYPVAGRESRETSYFLGMYLRLIRAIDVLAAQPEWDGKVLVVWGHSQGGGQSLAAGGLDSRVTLIAPGVPAMCDHSGRVIGRINGWPGLVPPGADGKPNPKVLAAARYFDAMNLATRTNAEAIVSVGFIDGVCPPTGIYATYNNLKGPKQMVERPLMGHAAPPDIDAAFVEAIARHIERMKNPQ
jgi:cephalosporin-C deacetylase